MPQAGYFHGDAAASLGHFFSCRRLACSQASLNFCVHRFGSSALAKPAAKHKSAPAKVGKRAALDTLAAMNGPPRASLNFGVHRFGYSVLAKPVTNAVQFQKSWPKDATPQLG